MFKYFIIIYFLILILIPFNDTFHQINEKKKTVKRKVQIAERINEFNELHHGHGEWPPFMGPHNSRPIIGILSQEISPPLVNCVPYYLSISKYKSYISASYVKYIEMAGARVVPIRWVIFEFR